MRHFASKDVLWSTDCYVYTLLLVTTLEGVLACADDYIYLERVYCDFFGFPLSPRVDCFEYFLFERLILCNNVYLVLGRP